MGCLNSISLSFSVKLTASLLVVSLIPFEPNDNIKEPAQCGLFVLEGREATGYLNNPLSS